MTVHQLFAAAPAIASSPDLPEPVSTAVSSGRANCAREIADRAHAWIEEAVKAREGMTPEQRRSVALEYMAQAQYARLDEKAPLYMTVIGRHAWFARIMMAED